MPEGAFHVQITATCTHVGPHSGRILCGPLRVSEPRTAEGHPIHETVLTPISPLPARDGVDLSPPQGDSLPGITPLAPVHGSAQHHLMGCLAARRQERRKYRQADLQLTLIRNLGLHHKLGGGEIYSTGPNDEFSSETIR